ncbi:MAG: OmpA family protein [Ilumatobacteraceae bacterium]
MANRSDPARPGGHHLTRRAVLLQGLGVLAAIFVVGIVVSKPFMERSLKDDGERALDERGIAAHLDFTFQDGRLLCADRIDDVDAAVAVVEAVQGVRSVSVDSVCENGLAPSTTAPPPSTGASSTAPATTASPSTTTAPSSTVASTTPPSTSPAAEPSLRASVADGVITLRGTVASAEQRDALLAASTAVVDGSNVVDDLRIDEASTLDEADVSSLATLIGAMVLPMASADVGWDATALFAGGTYVDEVAARPFADAARAAGITPALAERPTASAADAAVVQDAMNEIVTAQPLPFGRGQITLGPEAAPEMQRLAGIAKRFAGVAIEVQGHTDSEGDPGRNLTLSERRAQAVAAELVRLGVPADDVTFRGFGETQLITDENGVELADQSRRVVFGVTLR